MIGLTTVQNLMIYGTSLHTNIEFQENLFVRTTVLYLVLQDPILSGLIVIKPSCQTLNSISLNISFLLVMSQLQMGLWTT